MHLYFFKRCIYLLEGGEAEGKGKNPPADSLPSMEPDMGLNPRCPRSRFDKKSRFRYSNNWATQVPMSCLFLDLQVIVLLFFEYCAPWRKGRPKLVSHANENHWQTLLISYPFSILSFSLAIVNSNVFKVAVSLLNFPALTEIRGGTWWSPGLATQECITLACGLFCAEGQKFQEELFTSPFNGLE